MCGMLFVMTGFALEFLDDNPLREAVLRGDSSRGCIRIYRLYCNREFTSSLEEFLTVLWLTSSMEACKKADLYPGYLGLS